jgi:hypothetical protein
MMLGAGVPIPPVVSPAETSSSMSLAVGLMVLVLVVALTVLWIIKLRAEDELSEPEPDVEPAYRAA